MNLETVSELGQSSNTFYNNLTKVDCDKSCYNVY